MQQRTPPPPHYVKHCGGLFRDMTIHDFDMARFLLPCDPINLVARGASLISEASSAEDIGQEIDTATVLLTTASGQQVHVINSRRAVYGYDQRIEAFGSGGLIALNNVTHSTLVQSSACGVVGDCPQHFFLERYAEAFQTALESFVRAVLMRAQMPVTGHDGLAALYLAEKANESLVTGESVTFNLSDDLAAYL